MREEGERGGKQDGVTRETGGHFGNYLTVVFFSRETRKTCMETTCQQGREGT